MTRLVAVVLVLLVSSCARYIPRDFWGGYSEAKISTGRYVVTGEAGRLDEVEDPVNFAYWRAEDLCRNIGFATFIVEDDRRPGRACILVVRCTNAASRLPGGDH
jgi:hypothetical protein